jgi:hypothetical protein
MTTIQSGLLIDETPIIRLENDFLQIDVAPSVGGRIISILYKPAAHEFLWRNASLKLERRPPASEYDPYFYGGIDELLPGVAAETVDGIPYPDHGELWTLALDANPDNDGLTVRGELPLCGLSYERRLTLRDDGPYLDLDYRLGNQADQPRSFAWAMHAPLRIEPGDQIDCPARFSRVADPHWSRWSSLEPFDWPQIGSERADLIPAPDGTVAALFLYELSEGRVGWRSKTRNVRFEYQFDQQIFPYVWYFASYGGFYNHYTALLEPSTTMPHSVNEARQLGQACTLAAGETLETRITIYAGPA